MSKHSNEQTGKKSTKLQDMDSPLRNDQDANADRGGTTDMDSVVRKDHRNSTGSGIGSKTNVTGSDFDGQVADQ